MFILGGFRIVLREGTASKQWPSFVGRKNCAETYLVVRRWRLGDETEGTNNHLMQARCAVDCVSKSGEEERRAAPHPASTEHIYFEVHIVAFVGLWLDDPPRNCFGQWGRGGGVRRAKRAGGAGVFAGRGGISHT